MGSGQSSWIKGFWQVADPKIWIASVIPMVVGAFVAFCFGNNIKPLGLLWFFFAAAGVFLVEIAKNALNEVVDYHFGVDPGIDEEHRTPFSGGKKSIVQGRLDITQCLVIAAVCFTAAGFIGLVLSIFIEPKVFLIGLAGFLLAIIYSLPPFKLCYRGFGEFAVGFAFGPVTVMGVYVLIEGRFDTLPLLVSLPLEFLIMNVLWINQFPDFEVDKAHGKKNLVVRLGKKKAVWGYAVLFLLSYLSLIAIALYAKNAVWLMSIATLPVAVKAVKNCYLNYNNIKRLISSNAATVTVYQLFGLSLVISAILDGIAF